MKLDVRVLVDALCAEYGGIRTYVDGLLRAWSEHVPGDDVHVALQTGSNVETMGSSRHELPVRRPEVVTRPWAQATHFHALSAALRPHVILTTSAAADVRPPVAPMATVIYDLRSELRPEQFSRGRRLLRRVSYTRTYSQSAGFVSISHRSLDDLHRLHPRTRAASAVVAHLGADHVRHWPTARRNGPAIAFAHHTNKNADLVIDAWRLLAETGEARPLLLLGVAGGLRDRLAAQIERHGLAETVTLAPFLPDAGFRAAITEADMVVFPSDFEGFGLPIVEGMAMGKPVVIGPEPASLEVAGGHAFLSDTFSAAGVAAAVRRAAGATPEQIADARRWSESFTWQACLVQTRSLLQEIAEVD